jgi:hypothetical protein
MILRWGLLFLVYLGAVTFGTVFTFVRTAEWAAGNSRSIGNTAGWVAAVPSIFIVVFSVAIVLAVLTWRSPAANRSNWRIFWNVIEIVWLVGTGLSVFGAISNQSVALRERIAGIYQQDLTGQRKSLAAAANELDAKYCKPEEFDGNLCARIRSLSSEEKILAKAEDIFWQFGLELARFAAQSPQSPVLFDVRKFDYDLFAYIENLKFESIDRKPVILPDWAIWLTIFSPHIFAFVLPLRLGRALAAFAL